MKRTLFVIVALVVATAAATGQTSVGVILGEPTGLSAKLWVSDGAAFDVAVAWSFTNTGLFYVHIDYQQHFVPFDVPSGRLPWFVGIGAKVYIGSDVTIGGRVPIGIVYEFADVPLEVFLEIAPGLLLFPATRFDAGGGLGLRYRF